MNNLITFARLRPSEELAYVIVPLGQIKDYLEDAEDGDNWEIVITKMTEKELRKLPEFQGW